MEGLVPYAPNAVISISYIHPFSLCNEYVTNLLILSLTALSPWMHGWFCECKYNKFQIRPQVRGFVLSIVNTTVKTILLKFQTPATWRIGSLKTFSIDEIVSIVKLWVWVPLILLLISDSFLPSILARSFCLRPFSSNILWILSTIRNYRPTRRLTSGETLALRASIMLLLFIAGRI